MKTAALFSFAAFILLWLWPLAVIALLGGILAVGIARLRRKSLAQIKDDQASVHRGNPYPEQKAPPLPVREPDDLSLRRLALGVISRRITEDLLLDFEDARWVWETPNPMRALANNESLYILLNRAGGYRRAEVAARGLQYAGLRIEGFHDRTPETIQRNMPETEGNDPESDAEPEPTDYSLVASTWIEDHSELLLEAAAESAHRKEGALLPADGLPDPASWPCLCGALVGDGFILAKPDAEGIRVTAA